MENCTSNFNESSVVDAETEFYTRLLVSTRFWVQRILVPSIMTVGIIGNVITIVIMTRRRMRSSTNYYLAALAIFDMLYLILVFVLSLKHYPNVSNESFYFYWSFLPVAHMLADTCSNSSVWLTVTFTVERYIAVCHPIRGKVLCTESRAKKAIVCVFLFCFAFTLPTPFEWQVEAVVDECSNNKTSLRLTPSELGNNKLYTTIYYWLTVKFFIFIPFLLLAVFNCFLIRSVHLSKVRRSTMTRDHRDDNSQENKITIMLIAVVILFLICQLPTACHMLYTSLNDIVDINQRRLMSSLGNIFNFLMGLNAAGNFVLYCLLSQKYRRTFVDIFCQCYARNNISQMNSICHPPSTVYSNVDTESPIGSSGTGRKGSKGSSPASSNIDVRLGSRSSPSQHSRGSPRTAYLRVPDHHNSSPKEQHSVEIVESSPSKRFVVEPWKKFKFHRKKDAHEEIHPLKNINANKCIVITATGVDCADLNSHSVV